jgi:hypothetical protein
MKKQARFADQHWSQFHDLPVAEFSRKVTSNIGKELL